MILLELKICLISLTGFLFNQVHLGDTPHKLTESDFENLAHKTEGFSGSDIVVCVSVQCTLVSGIPFELLVTLNDCIVFLK